MAVQRASPSAMTRRWKNKTVSSHNLLFCWTAQRHGTWERPCVRAHAHVSLNASACLWTSAPHFKTEIICIIIFEGSRPRASAILLPLGTGTFAVWTFGKICSINHFCASLLVFDIGPSRMSGCSYAWTYIRMRYAWSWISIIKDKTKTEKFKPSTETH